MLLCLILAFPVAIGRVSVLRALWWVVVGLVIVLRNAITLFIVAVLSVLKDELVFSSNFIVIVYELIAYS
jgi:hypothetical protein